MLATHPVGGITCSECLQLVVVTLPEQAKDEGHGSAGVLAGHTHLLEVGGNL